MINALALAVLVWAQAGASESRRNLDEIFDKHAATHVSVHLPLPGDIGSAITSTTLQGMVELPGVRSAAVARETQAAWNASPVIANEGQQRTKLYYVQGDAEALGVTGERGRSMNSLGMWVGASLRLTEPISEGSDIVVDGVRHQIGGVIARADGLPEADQALLQWVDHDTAFPTYVGYIVLLVEPGSAAIVADNVASFLMPSDPGRLKISYPGEAVGLRETVSNELHSALQLAAVGISALGVLAMALATVLKQLAMRKVVGLFRAMGASRLWLTLVSAGEASVVGIVGGVAGVSLGTATVLACNPLLLRSDIPWAVVVLGPMVAICCNVAATLAPIVVMTKQSPAQAIRA